MINLSLYEIFTGVLADGRCLFRALAHGACLQSGEEAPDESRQTELADELRARVSCLSLLWLNSRNVCEMKNLSSWNISRS